MELHQIYKPITATPFYRDRTHIEIEPCLELKPYIRCFWGSITPYHQTASATQSLVIPDSCMDIIFDINFTLNTITSSFYGINDSTFTVDHANDKSMLISTFGIRFYAWSAVLFSEESMNLVKNEHFSVEYHFPKLKRELEPLLFEITNIYQIVAIVEKYLLNFIHHNKEYTLVMKAVSEILQSKGNLKILNLHKELHTSTRQIERLFREYVGISPKQFSSLVRYQYLWNSIVNEPNFNTLDKVYQLGYTDQAHMLNDFKRFHTMTPSLAKELALNYVAFLQ